MTTQNNDRIVHGSVAMIIADQGVKIKAQQEKIDKLESDLDWAIKAINDARWDGNETPYPKHELIEIRKRHNLDKSEEV